VDLVHGQFSIWRDIFGPIAELTMRRQWNRSALHKRALRSSLAWSRGMPNNSSHRKTGTWDQVTRGKHTAFRRHALISLRKSHRADAESA